MGPAVVSGEGGRPVTRIWIDEPNDPMQGLRVSGERIDHGWDQNRDGYEVPDDVAERWLKVQAAWDDLQDELGKLQARTVSEP